MNFLHAIAHLFSAWFGKASDVMQAILHYLSSSVNVARPLVQELMVLAAAFTPGTAIPEIITVIVKWLGSYVNDAQAIELWVAANQSLGLPDILRNAAKLALQYILPANSKTASELNWAIETAYQIEQRLAAPAALTAGALTADPVPVLQAA